MGLSLGSDLFRSARLARPRLQEPEGARERPHGSRGELGAPFGEHRFGAKLRHTLLRYAKEIGDLGDPDVPVRLLLEPAVAVGLGHHIGRSAGYARPAGARRK